MIQKTESFNFLDLLMHLIHKMSDYIVDIDEELLGLFEDHEEVMYLSFLSIINSC